MGGGAGSLDVHGFVLLVVICAPAYDNGAMSAARKAGAMKTLSRVSPVLRIARDGGVAVIGTTVDGPILEDAGRDGIGRAGRGVS